MQQEQLEQQPKQHRLRLQRRKKKKKMNKVVEYDVPFWERWPSLKAFKDGGFAGYLLGLTSYVPFAAVYYSPLFSQVRGNPKFAHFNTLAQACPNGVVIRTLTSSVQLGLFEILRNKAIVSNDGMELTLCQEAACGLAAGAAEAYLWFPLSSACLPVVDPKDPSVVRPARYRNIFQALYSMTSKKNVSALWANAGPNVKIRTSTNVGMLASYNPTLHYLRDSRGLSETRAQLGASVVSSFFATACSVPVANVLALRKVGCDPLNFLKSRPLALFAGFSRNFAFAGPPIVILWFAYENIRN